MSNVWFDRVDIDKKAPEVIKSLNSIERDIKMLIKKENDIGISSNRIIVGNIAFKNILNIFLNFIYF